MLKFKLIKITKDSKTQYSYKCKRCGQQLTKFYIDISLAKKELKRKDHSKHVCNWFLENKGK